MEFTLLDEWEQTDTPGRVDGTQSFSVEHLFFVVMYGDGKLFQVASAD